jgi:hypothetical protein
MRRDLYGDPIPEPEEEKKPNYFYKFFKDITYGQANIMLAQDIESEYEPYNMNKNLSYSTEWIFTVNDMNGLPHLPNRLQYDYFINSIRRRSRKLESWIKPEKSKDLEAVKEYYNYSNQKARDSMLLLSDTEIEYIKSKTYKGGKENDK